MSVQPSRKQKTLVLKTLFNLYGESKKTLNSHVQNQIEDTLNFLKENDTTPEATVIFNEILGTQSTPSFSFQTPQKKMIGAIAGMDDNDDDEPRRDGLNADAKEEEEEKSPRSRVIPPVFQDPPQVFGGGEETKTIYCGLDRANKPPNSIWGNRLQCLRKGYAVGKGHVRA